MTHYEVDKLALNLVPVLLSAIKGLGRLEAHRITVFLRSHLPFYLIKNDPLELEKVKAAQAIEEFLKVRLFTQSCFFFFFLLELIILNVIERKRFIHGFEQHFVSSPRPRRVKGTYLILSVKKRVEVDSKRWRMPLMNYVGQI